MQGNGNRQTDRQIAMRVSVRTIIVNVALSAVKLAAGILGRSGAMLSDAVHSLSDVLSTGIVMIGIRISHKAPDENHQYGHERFESVAAILLAVLLALTGGGIGWAGVERILASIGDAVGSAAGAAGAAGSVGDVPGLVALLAAALSIIVKEGMYWYTRRAAKRIRSGALMADAWHHRSDALSSVGSFVGILGARLGLPVLDPVASVVICLFILKAAYDIFKDAIRKMTDEACDGETAARIRGVIGAQPGVLGVDRLKTRVFGNRLYVDVEIRADGSQTLEEAHAIAARVHDAIEDAFEDVKHCMVHVNPGKNSG